MMHRVRLLMLSLLALVAPACASFSAPFGEGRYDLILENQITGAGSNDLYELIQKMRPFWIAKGGNDTAQNPGKIYVFLDGTRMGGLETLRMIPIAGVTYIRWYDGMQAASRWGLDHDRGVIFVSTQPLEL